MEEMNLSPLQDLPEGIIVQEMLPPFLYLISGRLIPAELASGPLLHILAISLVGDLPHTSEDPPVETENLLPEEELEDTHSN